MNDAMSILSKHEGCLAAAEAFFRTWINDEFDGDFDAWLEDVFASAYTDERLPGLEIPTVEGSSTTWFYHPVRGEWMGEDEFEDLFT
jgi:hypothetical protein